MNPMKTVLQELKPKQRSKRTSNEEQPKKKSSLVKAKYNDFLKFSQNDKNASESDGSESSSDEEEKKIIKIMKRRN